MAVMYTGESKRTPPTTNGGVVDAKRSVWQGGVARSVGLYGCREDAAVMDIPLGVPAAKTMSLMTSWVLFFKWVLHGVS